MLISVTIYTNFHPREEHEKRGETVRCNLLSKFRKHLIWVKISVTQIKTQTEFQNPEESKFSPINLSAKIILGRSSRSTWDLSRHHHHAKEMCPGRCGGNLPPALQWRHAELWKGSSTPSAPRPALSSPAWPCWDRKCQNVSPSVICQT